ncbi:uncharacterized protein Bfra_009946 [Botrytis fragariae]|uniref:Uncharacterized protein n=1 Tax=Botrytis fragariae TaxID=1964551 RepID=A0A8H6EFT5_9HELO|nr:uncharacterized protein Bfra_009946 [Botrytis fragariae]KAF5870558.1 hypothetical protein Bfra_009946 [Botrytis fragariae]
MMRWITRKVGKMEIFHPNFYEHGGLATAQCFDPYGKKKQIEPPINARNGEKLACEEYLGRERYRFRIY